MAMLDVEVQARIQEAFSGHRCIVCGGVAKRMRMRRPKGRPAEERYYCQDCCPGQGKVTPPPVETHVVRIGCWDE